METSYSTNLNTCESAETIGAYALQVLPASELAEAEAHIASCPDCRRELESLRPVLDRFAGVQRPATGLQSRLARRIAAEDGKETLAPPARQWLEPDWEEVAPGLECKLLASDAERRRVGMLVRLAPGATYPLHPDAGAEELHLLAGELCIDGHRLLPGDCSYGAPGAGDDRVFGETDRTCVFVASSCALVR